MIENKDVKSLEQIYEDLDGIRHQIKNISEKVPMTRSQYEYLSVVVSRLFHLMSDIRAHARENMENGRRDEKTNKKCN